MAELVRRFFVEYANKSRAANKSADTASRGMITPAKLSHHTFLSAVPAREVTSDGWRASKCVCVCVCVYADNRILEAVLPTMLVQCCFKSEVEQCLKQKYEKCECPYLFSGRNCLRLSMPSAKKPYITADGRYDLIVALGLENVEYLIAHKKLVQKLKQNDATGGQPQYLVSRQHFTICKQSLVRLRRADDIRKSKEAELGKRKLVSPVDEIATNKKRSRKGKRASSSSSSAEESHPPVSSSNRHRIDDDCFEVADDDIHQAESSELLSSADDSNVVAEAVTESAAEQLPQPSAPPKGWVFTGYESYLGSSDNKSEEDVPIVNDDDGGGVVQPNALKEAVIASVDARVRIMREEMSSTSDELSDDAPPLLKKRVHDVKRITQKSIPDALTVIIDDENAPIEYLSETDSDDNEHRDQRDDDIIPDPKEIAGIAKENKRIQHYFDSIMLPAVDEHEAEVESSAAVKEKPKTILQLEIDARIAAIRNNDVKNEVKWKGLLTHVAALLNLPESHSTMVLQLLKGSGIDSRLNTLPETGKGLMQPPIAEVNANRLKYMYVFSTNYKFQILLLQVYIGTSSNTVFSYVH
jgi:hypothetical protein